MTGILIAFTGRLLPYIPPEQIGGTCVAHGVANTAVIMGYEFKAKDIADRLGIGFTGGYDPRKLPSALPEYNISAPVQLTSGELQAKLLSGPLIATVLESGITIANRSIKSHTFAVLGKYQTGSWVANSRGTGFGWSGYGMMPDDQLSGVWFQTIGTGYIDPPRYIEIHRKLSLIERSKILRAEQKKKSEEIKARRKKVIQNMSK